MGSCGSRYLGHHDYERGREGGDLAVTLLGWTMIANGPEKFHTLLCPAYMVFGCKFFSVLWSIFTSHFWVPNENLYNRFFPGNVVMLALLSIFVWSHRGTYIRNPVYFQQTQRERYTLFSVFLRDAFRASVATSTYSCKTFMGKWIPACFEEVKMGVREEIQLLVRLIFP